MNKSQLTIDVDGSKAFDELSENIRDLKELCDLIPDWQKDEALHIAQRIAQRHAGWVTIKNEL